MENRRKFLYSLVALGGTFFGLKAANSNRRGTVCMKSVTIFPENIPSNKWSDIEKEIYNLDAFSKLRTEFVLNHKIISDEISSTKNGYSWTAFFRDHRAYAEWVSLTQPHVDLENLKKYKVKSFFWLA